MDTLKFVLKKVLVKGSMARRCYDQNFAVVRLWAPGEDAIWFHLGMGNLQSLVFAVQPLQFAEHSVDAFVAGIEYPEGQLFVADGMPLGLARVLHAARFDYAQTLTKSGRRCQR